MGKKSKIRRQKKQNKSARGHVEQLTDRYRLKQTLVPVDKHGNEIEDTPLAPPMMPSERRALAKAMLEQTGGTTSVEKSLQPEPDVSPPPKATNVVSLCERRAANEEHKLTATQEAQATINYERMLYHQWSKDKSKRYFSERELYALEFRQLLEYAASHPNGRNDEPPTVKDEVQKPVSMVHNPGLSANPINPETEAGGYCEVDKRARPVSVHNQRNRDQAEWYRKFGDMSSKPSGKTPSGRLIREFTENIQPSQPPEKSTEVRRSKDWGRAKLPGSNGARAWAAEDQLFTMIDMVPEEHWPMEHIEQFLFKGDDGEWHVHTGKVRQAISNQEDRIINRAVTLAFIQHSEDQQEFIKHLESELKSLKTHFNILDFQYSTLIGEPTDHSVSGTAQYLRAKRNNYATAYAKPPELGKLVAEFRVFNYLAGTVGINEAFSRFHYGTPDVAKMYEAEEERRIVERIEKAQPKLENLRLRAFLREVPLLIKLQRERDYMQQLSAKHSLVARETYALWKMHKRNHKPALVKKAYLSGLVIEQVRFHENWKVTMNGKAVVADVVDVTCHKYTTELKQPAHNYRREFDKQLKVRPRPTYEEVVPTACMKGVPVVLARLEDQVNRWQQWIDGCLDRDAERQAAELEAQQQAMLDAEVQRFKEIQNKPINKLVGNIIRGLTTLKRIGDKDVYVTKKERAEREENARILRERTENEIREQEKLAEKERREEAEREARRAARRSKRARKKAEKRAAQAEAEEQARLKAAAKKAFRSAH